MTQTQLLGFVIQKGAVTSADVAEHFKIPVTFAHQVLRRLQDKGILVKTGGPYRFQFQLSNQARQKLEDLNNNHKNYGWIFVLGLAAGLLIGFASSKKGNEKKDDTKGKSQR